MKSVIAAALVLCAAGAGAESVDIGGVRQNLFATCFATDQEGWMAGELGRIFRTTDGGATWTQQDAHTKRPFLAMSCLDAKTAWVAGKEGIVYGTKDGGVTWTQLQTGSQRHIFALEFASPQVGHGAGDYGTMIHTEDGGASWTVSRVADDVKLPESALDTGVDPGDVNIYGISFGDPEHVWQVGEFGVGLASQDAGKTWRQQTTPVRARSSGCDSATRSTASPSASTRSSCARRMAEPPGDRSHHPSRVARCSTSSCAGSRAGSSVIRARC